MALGNGGQEWPGGDNFAIGRVAPGANYTSPNVFFIVDNAGKLHTSGGIVFPDGSLGARAQAQGPRGPQGPTGAQGPQGPPGAPLFAVCTNESPFPVSCFNSCNNVVVSKVISAGQTCSADGVSNACGAVTNGGTGIPTTYGMCCTCK